MKKLFRPYLAALLLGSLLFTTACGDDDDPEPTNEEELITSMTLSLVPQDKAQQPITATFSDPDGDGGNDPTIEPILLAPNTIYDATITFANSEGDITSEISEEGIDHKVIFDSTSDIVKVQATDADAKGLPIGLEYTVTTTNSGTAKLTVTLMHQPGLKTSTSGTSVGSTDATATFEVTVR